MSEVMKIADQVGLLNALVRSALDKIELNSAKISRLVEENNFDDISIHYARIGGMRSVLNLIELEIDRLMVEADAIAIESLTETKKEATPSFCDVKSQLQGEIERIDYLLKDSAFGDETTMYIAPYESCDRGSAVGLLHRRAAIEFAIQLVDGQIKTTTI